MKRRHSIRWRLPLTYAGIALLTALALGSVLLVTLQGYYREIERDYLVANANMIADLIGESLQDQTPDAVLQAQIESLSFFAQARIRLMNADEDITLDSGSRSGTRRVFVQVVEDIGGVQTEETEYYWSAVEAGPGSQVEIVEQGTVTNGGVAEVTVTQPDDRSFEIDSAADFTLFVPGINVTSGLPLPGTELSNAHSTVTARSPIITADGEIHGFVLLDEGPAYGRAIITSVAWGVSIAGVIAVVLAALTGFAISRRISAPLLMLSNTTSRMAEGDLSVRVDLERSDEIGVLASSFNHMADQIQEMVTTLRRLISDAAHEFHTPLTALHTNLEMAQGDVSSAGQTTHLERSLAQLKRLETMTSNLMALSQLESGVLDIELEALNLSALVREIVEVYASQAEQAEIAFTVDIPREDVMVEGSGAHLHRALGNLLENAIKFTPESGHITVALEPDAELVRVSIEDDGIGIDEREMAHIFERFSRGRNASAYPGSGLGLAITRAIIHKHGGTIEVERLEAGTRFTIRLAQSDDKAE